MLAVVMRLGGGHGAATWVGGRRRPLGTQLGWLGQWAETLLGLRDKGEGDGLQPLGLN
jgi:hypothetical protein